MRTAGLVFAVVMAVTAVAPRLARADTIDVYGLHTGLSAGGTVAGTFDFDLTTGLYSAVDLAVTGGGAANGDVFDTVIPPSNSNQLYASASDGNGDILQIFFGLPPNVCLLAGCGGEGFILSPTGQQLESSGTVSLSLQSVTTTPLPDALSLFASGAGLFGFIFGRRKRKAVQLKFRTAG